MFLLALAFSCHRSELQALSKDPQDLVLWEGGMYVELSGGFVPKVGQEGSPTSQMIANWISECVSFTHSQRPDLPVRAVSAKEVHWMSESWAFHDGAHSVDKILQASSWACQSTFTSFYLADVLL